MELIYDIPSLHEDMIHEDSFTDEHVFLILTIDPWYGDISFIYGLWRFPLTSWGMNDGAYIINLRTTLLSVTHCIDGGWIPFCIVVWLTMRLILCWIIAMVERVVVIYLGLLHPKKQLEWVTIGHQSSKIVLMRSSDATLSKCLHGICAHTSPRYILLSSSLP